MGVVVDAFNAGERILDCYELYPFALRVDLSGTLHTEYGISEVFRAQIASIEDWQINDPTIPRWRFRTSVIRDQAEGILASLSPPLTGVRVE